jgi:hypothetical protein
VDGFAPVCLVGTSTVALCGQKNHAPAKRRRRREGGGGGGDGGGGKEEEEEEVEVFGMYEVSHSYLGATCSRSLRYCDRYV